MTAAALSPSLALELWFRQPGRDQERVLGFCNSVTTLLMGDQPEERVSIGELGLPTLAYNALRRSNYAYIDQLVDVDVRELMRLRGIGEKMAREICQAVSRYWTEVAPLRELRKIDGPAQDLLAMTSRPAETVTQLEKAFYSMTEDRERMAALLFTLASMVKHQPLAAETLRQVGNMLLEANHPVMPQLLAR